MTSGATAEVLSAVPIFNECVDVPLVGEVCLAITYDPDYPAQIQVCVTYDGEQACMTVDISDLLCIPIGIDDAGIEICFDNWKVTESEVCFNIAIKVCAIFCVTAVSFGPICFSTDALSRLRAGTLADEERASLKRAMAIQAAVMARQARAQSGGRCGC